MKTTYAQPRVVARAALLAAGVPTSPAQVQLDQWLEAELRGQPSHGLLRLPRIVERIRGGLADPVAIGESRWSDNLLSVDGQRGLGPVIALHALDLVLGRAAETGVAVAAISNSNHLGMLAPYVEAGARRGMMTIALSTSEALVHPWGGRVAMVGSNPIAIGIPADPEPFVLDMATSAVSAGKILDHAHRGAALEEGWAIDAEGRPTTDAVAATSGAIAPFGGAKGYGLGLAIELLVGGLASHSYGRDVRGTLDSTEVCNKGDLLIVIRPGDPQRASAGAGAYLDAIRDSPRAPGVASIDTPGDRARRRRSHNLDHGLDVPDPVWARLVELAGPISPQPRSR
jgi:L-2-hydroxycarboxylate dehydrogenase (NAD+)